jgi:hypothetical protein
MRKRRNAFLTEIEADPHEANHSVPDLPATTIVRSKNYAGSLTMGKT